MNLAKREVIPEILDELPGEDPRAVASRRDLARTNALMLQAPLMARLLFATMPAPPRRILEIGAGDGAASLGMAKRLSKRWKDVELVLLDQQDIVPPKRRAAFESLGWRLSTVQADAFDWLEGNAHGFDLALANLFLHHFEGDELRHLLRLMAAAAPAVAATEPVRGPLPYHLSRLFVIGANDVTRHDASVSVRGGFKGSELRDHWPHEAGWRIEERQAGLFLHEFAAVRETGSEPA
ncbi:methyltransferase domain-containing protein [Lutibaculum baratangense]|uniref:Methyltransferase domain-containing protein n=1 Tax=Lutibaculum baratangense AMV1 TaxID=631454 RepID=V4T7R8_9HYPH|nr:class I SAM-dependent methyltransferase [Lutibaculum baratangense]ESR22653.1 hypothetical protein N177_3790 [Lutibaculum baratangense AMV1]